MPTYCPFRPAPAVPPVVDMAIHAAQVLTWDGDSITSGLAGVTFVSSMQTAITNAYNGAGKTVPTYNNVAVGGRTSSVTVANVATPIATAPDHIFLLSSINDTQQLSLTQTLQNYQAYFAAVLASRPNCRFHVISNLFNSTNGGATNGELWPDGSNPFDARTVQINTFIQTAVRGLASGQAEYLDVRTAIWAIDCPAQNPGNSPTGVMTQDGVHPSALGAGLMSTRVMNLLTLNLS